MPDTHNEELEAINRVIAGDADEFEVIVRMYGTYVYKIAASYVPADVVPEAAQEVFVNAFGSLASFNGKSPFKYWLRTITVRTCYDYWRAHYKRQDLPMSALGEEHQRWFDRVVNEGSMETFRDTESQRDAAEILNWAMSELTPVERMAITLVYLEGYSVKEAAQVLNLSVINVKVRAHRGRAKLRDKILGHISSSKREGML